MDAEPLSEQALLGDERTQLEAFLHDNRRELAGVVEGLTEEQARRRLVPSLTTPLGLVKHAVFAEKVWFHVAVAGMSRADLGVPETPEESFVLDPEDTVASALAELHATWEEADAIAAGLALDEPALHNRRGPLSLRWIYVHLIEELARHAGHGDILREQILAQDGQDGQDRQDGQDGQDRQDRLGQPPGGA